MTRITRVIATTGVRPVTTFPINVPCLPTIGGSRIFENGTEKQDNIISPALPSFISNVHNELYTFYAGQGNLQKKFLRPIGGGCCPQCPSTLNQPPIPTILYGLSAGKTVSRVIQEWKTVPRWPYICEFGLKTQNRIFTQA